MITREQVADLRAGDVVEYRDQRFPDVVTRGPIRHLKGEKGIALGGHVLLAYSLDGDVPEQEGENGSITVVSRAPRPLYVNHNREKPVPGDVVRDADGDDVRTWTKNSNGFSHEWLNNKVHVYQPRENLPAHLRLLVDGETGQVVP